MRRVLQIAHIVKYQQNLMLLISNMYVPRDISIGTERKHKDACLNAIS
jgi:hypothetical protein